MDRATKRTMMAERRWPLPGLEVFTMLIAQTENARLPTDTETRRRRAIQNLSIPMVMATRRFARSAATALLELMYVG